MATDVVLPMLGITVERGKIVEWIKKEGYPVEKGEIIFVVEVEKATTEVESPATGILAKILVPEGLEVPVLTVVAVITAQGEELPEEYEAVQPGKEAVAEGAGPAVVGVTMVPPEQMPEAPEAFSGIVKVVPAARQLARAHDVDLQLVTGTGLEGVILLKDVEAAIAGMPEYRDVKVSTLARKLAEKEAVPLEAIEGRGIRGRIMRADIQAFLEKAAAAGPGLGEIIPMSSVRKVIARRMSESAFTAPHIYFFTDVCLDPLLGLRKQVLPDFEKHFELRPSINDFLIKAVALNILDFPMLNAQIKGEEIHIMPEVNMGLAVAVPEGLIVPAIAHADRSGLVNITRQRMDLVERARQGKLTLAEMERGTFTISSLAHYDITHFTAILNPPQSGILSVGKTDDKLVMVDGQVEVRRVARLGLSVDHRIIDGAVSADFLQNLKLKLERPAFTFITL